MKELINQIHMHAMLAARGQEPCDGIVTSYDPDRYAVKVELQPPPTGGGSSETGWIPLESPWVGNGWGFAAGPSIGDLVRVEFQDGDPDVPQVTARFFNDQDRPMPVPSGECWMVHKSGSLLKFRDDGSVELASAGDMRQTVGGNYTLSVAGTANMTAANWNVHGPVTWTGNHQIAGSVAASGDITDNCTTQSKTMAQMRVIYNGHTHHIASVQTGGSTVTSNTPDQQE